MKHVQKKGLSALLVLCLMLSLLPYAAFAQGTQEKKLVAVMQVRGLKYSVI